MTIRDDEFSFTFRALPESEYRIEASLDGVKQLLLCQQMTNKGVALAEWGYRNRDFSDIYFDVDGAYADCMDAGLMVRKGWTYRLVEVVVRDVRDQEALDKGWLE